jgi:hypothetical protein
VSREDRVDLGRHALGDRGGGPGHDAAVVRTASAVVALVEQHDLCLDAQRVENVGGPVDRLHLIADLQALDRLRRHDLRQVLEGGADDPDRHVTGVLDAERQQRGEPVRKRHVRAEEREVRALERAPELAAVGRVAAAELHALQLLVALIELVVADDGSLDTEAVEEFDRRLVVEQGRTTGDAPTLSPAESTIEFLTWACSCLSPTTPNGRTAEEFACKAQRSLA